MFCISNGRSGEGFGRLRPIRIRRRTAASGKTESQTVVPWGSPCGQEIWSTARAFLQRSYGVTVTEFAAMRAGAGGSAIHRIKYARTPVPANNTSSNHTMRTNVGSRPKYSARPPQTPAIFLLVVERVKRFGVGALYAGVGAEATRRVPQL